LDRPRISRTAEPAHRTPETRIVDIGIEDRIAFGKATVLPYQVVDRLGCVASQHDLVIVNAQRAGDAPYAFRHIRIELLSCIKRVLRIDHACGVDVGILHGMRHLSPEAVFEIDDTDGAVVMPGDLGPEVFILCQR